MKNTNILSTEGLKQLFLLAIILLIGFTLIWNLRYFLPGTLGAITLYIVSRKFFIKLTEKKKWKKWIAASFIIIMSIIIFIIPVWIIVELLIPKFSFVFNNTDKLIEKATEFINVLKGAFPQIKISTESIQEYIQKAALLIPAFLNATLGLVINVLTALFLLYFMFMGKDQMEKQIIKFLPMNATSQDELWIETKNMVVSNAIGIPVLILCQCIIAIIGYYIFGVEQPIVWGVLTGVASIIPVVGTMVIWIPICAVMFATGNLGMAIGLTLYAAIIISNIDNVLRFGIMKKIGNVHPLITVFGVLVGLNVFGLMGLIFGPLLITYFLLMVKIYRAEYRPEKNESKILFNRPEE